MSGIKDIIAQEQYEERQRAMYEDYLINSLITVISSRNASGLLTELEKNIIISSCNEGGRFKGKYAIKLLSILDK